MRMPEKETVLDTKACTNCSASFDITDVDKQIHRQANTYSV